MTRVHSASRPSSGILSFNSYSPLHPSPLAEKSKHSWSSSLELPSDTKHSHAHNALKREIDFIRTPDALHAPPSIYKRPKEMEERKAYENMMHLAASATPRKHWNFTNNALSRLLISCHCIFPCHFCNHVEQHRMVTVEGFVFLKKGDLTLIENGTLLMNATFCVTFLQSGLAEEFGRKSDIRPL